MISIIFTTNTHMLPRPRLIPVDVLAAKHGQAPNQRSHFDYLLREKTFRKRHSRDKENDDPLPAIPQDITRSKEKAREEVEGCLSPLTLQECNYNSNQLAIMDLPEQAAKEENLKTQALFEGESGEGEMMQSPQFEVISYSFESELETTEVACMTDECYLVKELSIKLEMVQKEREEILASFDQVVNENEALKKVLETLTVDAAKSADSAMQTNPPPSTECCGVSTQTTGDYIAMIEANLASAQQEVEETLELCSQLLGDYDSGPVFEGLKDALSQCMQHNMSQITSQFQRETALLQEMYEESSRQAQYTILTANSELTQYKAMLNQALELQTATEEKAALERQHLEAVYEEQLKKVKDKLAQTAKDAARWEKEANNYKQVYQSSREGWGERQRVYDRLLTDARTTISGLALQMRQFEQMAGKNYSRSQPIRPSQ